MKFEGPVNYIKPEDSNTEDQFKHHRFEIKNDGEVIAAAEVHYYSRPFPFYQVSDLYTEFDHTGKGYASAILTEIENFLRERGKPGVLVDAILSDAPGVLGMYERRGWKSIDDLGRRVFNLPDTIDPAIFKGYEMRGENVSAS